MPDDHEGGQPSLASVASAVHDLEDDIGTSSLPLNPATPNSALDDTPDALELSIELTPPPLPPRPANLDLLDDRPPGSIRLSKRASRPQLLSKSTTAVSLADVHTGNYHEGSNIGSNLASPAQRAISRGQSSATITRFVSRAGSDAGDSNSVRSFAPTVAGEVESLLGDVQDEQATPAWKALSAQLEHDNPFEHIFADDEIFSIKIHHEFDEMETFNADGSNEGIQSHLSS